MDKPKKVYSLIEVVEHIDYFTNNDDWSPKSTPASIYITPPDEVKGDVTDEDSADEEGDTFEISRLGRKLLSAEAEPVNFQMEV